MKRSCRTTCTYTAKHCLASCIPGWVFHLIVIPWVLLTILITCQLIYIVKIKGIINIIVIIMIPCIFNEFSLLYVVHLYLAQNRRKQCIQDLQFVILAIHGCMGLHDTRVVVNFYDVDPILGHISVQLQLARGN